MEKLRRVPMLIVRRHEHKVGRPSVEPTNHACNVPWYHSERRKLKPCCSESRHKLDERGILGVVFC